MIPIFGISPEILVLIIAILSMRILHFYRTFFPDTMGGIEQTIDQIARGMQLLGVGTDVLTTSNATCGTVEHNGYKLHRVHRNFEIASNSFSISAFKRFAQLADQCDLIHYHFPWPFMDIVHFASRVNKPTVVSYHSDIIRQKYLSKLYRPLKQRFLTSVDRIIATSSNYLATSPVLQKFKHKVNIIPIGLDCTTYPIPSSERLEHWKQKFNQRFFLFIGALRYYKGLHILLEAASETDFPIVIIGNGPLEQELKAQASELRLNNVHFLGQLPDEDKVALLTLCYAMVFPSHLRSEAFGISLLEGAMYGKPMISCEIGTGTTSINIKNKTGLVIPPCDPVALRQSMHFLWDHPECAAQMGQCARERYCEYFTAEKMIQSHFNLYQDILDDYHSKKHKLTEQSVALLK